MLFFFSLLALVYAAFTGASLWFILGPHNLSLHFYSGLMATIAALVAHCWVFFYFIGTGEGIREGILANQLDTAAIKRTKKFKAKTFPFALFSMIFMIVGTVLGAGVQTRSVGHGWHVGFVAFAILFNAFTFWQEFRVIRENQNLMDRLNAEVETSHSANL